MKIWGGVLGLEKVEREGVALSFHYKKALHP